MTASDDGQDFSSLALFDSFDDTSLGEYWDVVFGGIWSLGGRLCQWRRILGRSPVFSLCFQPWRLCR
jgi:hypothetical protein